MKLFVISDLHLEGPSDPFYQALIELIETRPQPEDAFVLAGDIFDVYIEDKPFFFERYKAFFQALEKQKKKGVQFYFIEGNHDFLLDSIFRKLGVHYSKNFIHLSLHEQQHSVKAFERTQFFIAHGDLVNSKDTGYLFLRKFLRNFWMRLFFKLMPGSWIHDLGEWASKKSQQARKKSNPGYIPPSVRTLFRAFSQQKILDGYDYVILGHCHDLDEMKFSPPSFPKEGHYVNLGYPKEHQSYVVWDSKENILKRLRLPLCL